VDEGRETKLRIYRISVTYDPYYYCPRMWLAGDKEIVSKSPITKEVTRENVPLTKEEIMEDVMGDYADKTVTYEVHPHLGVHMATIHPCKHSEVLKTMVARIEENKGVVNVENALFIFLKFMTAIIPTIEYDKTIDINLG
jgi:ubiquitin-like-conjugating enzyme ATG3